MFGSVVLLQLGRDELVGMGSSQELSLAVSPPPLFTVSSTSEQSKQHGRGWTRVFV